ncbi:carbohydrate ABC transporter permease [Bacillaceae bacterium SIJ1]|uniref:carbohydrate ABC transporter permease n=1 Tax=Litoribacterium kuwaitense TaxID=1398745 RepID=UPI0013ED9D15|nr:carbohydrate ABC transporter permease [Litoribacterium kuwaitense]NGP45250.1 carbohydrate ABC transporter permease [Litoribacterium kuwaitense]
MSLKEKALRQTLLLLSAAIMLFPFVYAFLISLMKPDAFNNAISLIPSELTLQNYFDVIIDVPILKFIVNSFFFASIVTIGHLITSSLAAYAFVFIPFPGKSVFFMLVLSTMMIPWEATIIPNYDTIITLGWIDSFTGLIVPHLALTLGIFLLRQHFMTIPKELHEASQLDGCSRFRFFWQMVLPLSKPMLAAIGTYSFITTWNQYLWPLLVTNSNEIRTVQIGLKMLISQEEQNSFPIIMAGIILILLPTLIILLIGHKYLQEGLTTYSQK